VRRDSSFRKELLREGVENLLAGDVETGKAVLRDYINATIGFGEPKSPATRPRASCVCWGRQGIRMLEI
jgi:hypothetical protein